MPTVTKAASTNAIVTTGWTNPTNAYVSDNVYATATPGTNATIDSDFGVVNFTTTDIPDGSVINGVTSSMEVIAASSVPVTITLRNNAVQVGTPTTHSTTTETTVTTGSGTVSLTDLRSASTLLKARVGATRSGTGATCSLDYVFFTVDYTAPSNELTALSISGATLSPTFNGASSQSYTATVLFANSTPTLTATAAVSNSSIRWRLNAGAWSSSQVGSFSGALSTLNVGSNTLEVEVTPGAGATKTYTVTVTRSAASTNANLATMAFSGITISPTFDGTSSQSYIGTVSSNVISTTLTATADSTVAQSVQYRVGGTGSYTSVGAGASITLSPWANTVEVRVTAESGATKTYTTIITQVASFDFQTNLTINGEPIATSIATNIKWGLV